jgi:uncharacterized protein YbjT (DUF2867 family)
VPVLVNAAHRPVARLLLARLIEEGGQVRALARDGVPALRAAGVFTAVGDPDDEELLEAACTGVHTLVHLAGGIGGDPATVEAEGRAVAAAAEGAGIRRVLLVTMAGSVADAEDPLRRAHAAVAAAVAAADVPSVEVRVGIVDTPGIRALLRSAGPPPELRDHAVEPVAAADLVEVLVALDAARSRATDGHLVLAATGSDATVGDLLDAAPGPRRGARLPSAAVRDALLATLAGPWVEPDPDAPSAWDLLGVVPGGPTPAGGAS